MSLGNTDVPCLVGELEQARGDACTLLEVLNRISGKWSISILLETTRGPVRFTELERSLRGISRRMLTLTLRNLERDGLLVRTVYPTVPPKVEYEATPMARELYDSLLGLTGWAQRHLGTIAAAREAYDAAAAR
jgi:DNA-binding HxlR family transcriptional regulator